MHDRAGDYFDTDCDSICCGDLWGNEMIDDPDLMDEQERDGWFNCPWNQTQEPGDEE